MQSLLPPVWLLYSNCIMCNDASGTELGCTKLNSLKGTCINTCGNCLSGSCRALACHPAMKQLLVTQDYSEE